MIVENGVFLKFWNIKSAFKVSEFHPKIFKSSCISRLSVVHDSYISPVIRPCKFKIVIPLQTNCS